MSSNTEQTKSYFAEAVLVLNREGFRAEMFHGGKLSVWWDDAPLCEISDGGTVHYHSADLPTPERIEAKDRVYYSVLSYYITLHPERWREHSYVACCGTSIQPVLKMLERLPQVSTVLLCLDNDDAGHLACQRMSEQLAEHYTVERLIPENKDWNDDLTAEKEIRNEVTQTCQSFG